MIYYEQSKPIEGKNLNVPVHKEEQFIFHLSRAFFPGGAHDQLRSTLPYWIFDKSHIEKLEGMCACWNEPTVNPYDELIRAIKRLGSVKVWRGNGET